MNCCKNTTKIAQKTVDFWSMNQYNNHIVSKKEQVMKISTAIAVLQKDADFLGMPFLDFLKFVKTNPMAQTQKTMEAFRVFEADAYRFFSA
jgi:hypothetical protein